jgi:hypothetical protein
MYARHHGWTPHVSQRRPLTVTEWREYLRGYSAEFLDSDYLRKLEAHGDAEFAVSPAQREAGWLGYEPASEEALAEAEHRLGIRLPPSYRNFLLASNGWSTMQNCVDLFEAEKIGWFPDLNPEFLDAWSEPGLSFFAGNLAVLKRSLLIGADDGGPGCYWLLHADSVAGNGEWTAYEWWPGDDPEPYDDFAAMATRPANG